MLLDFVTIADQMDTRQAAVEKNTRRKIEEDQN